MRVHQDDVLDIEEWGDPAAPVSFLAEVPHGATSAEEYLALAAQMESALPPGLIDFFFVNTDVGAAEIGRAVARALVARGAVQRARMVRCRLPRTLVDTNRVPALATGDLSGGGMTAAVPVYVTAPADHARLDALHRAYVARVDAEVDAVVAAGGLVFTPHSYAPRSVGIARVDADIVPALHAAWAPGTAETWPMRPAVDLITTPPGGASLAPAGLVERVRAGFAALGVDAVENGTYALHPATQGHRLSVRAPGRVLGAELRRDLLVHRWEPFTEMAVDLAAVARLAAPFVEGFAAILSAPLDGPAGGAES